jgi:exosortase/archaeosortase family protein
MTLPVSSTGVPYLPDATQVPGHTSRPRLGLLARTILYLVIFAALQSLYATTQGTWVEHLVIDRMTVGTAARLIDALDPALGVTADGSRLRAPGGGINILNGCEGTEVVFLLASAMLVAPMTWRRRLLGVAVGTTLVFALNQLRVLTLFYAFRSDRALFDTLHGFVAPLVLIAVTGAFFMVWVEYCRKDASRT